MGTTTKAIDDLTIGDQIALYDGTRNYERRIMTVTSTPRPSQMAWYVEVETTERVVSAFTGAKVEVVDA